MVIFLVYFCFIFFFCFCFWILFLDFVFGFCFWILFLDFLLSDRLSLLCTTTYFSNSTKLATPAHHPPFRSYFSMQLPILPSTSNAFAGVFDITHLKLKRLLIFLSSFTHKSLPFFFGFLFFFLSLHLSVSRRRPCSGYLSMRR